MRLPADPDTPAAIDVLALGDLLLASGQLAGTDPIAPLRVDVLDLDIAPGRYPTFLSCAADRPAALLVRLGEALPTSWEDASALDVEPGWATVEVDSGTVAFTDAGLAAALQDERRGVGPWFPVPGGISARMHEAIVDQRAAVVAHERSNAVLANVGGDYPYPLVWGRDDTGRVVAVVIDCCELAVCIRPWEPDTDRDWEG